MTRVAETARRIEKKIEGFENAFEPLDTDESAEAMPTPKPTRTPAKNGPDGAVACAASSVDSDGKTANEKTFRGVIRRLREKEAAEGSDGAVTITFQKLVVSAPRAWRANLSDA